MTRSDKAADTLLAALSRILRVRREYLSMSQEELSNRSGLHRTYISDVERGSRNPSIKSLAQLAAALQTSVSELLAATEAEGALQTSPLEILLVEDHQADVHLITTAIKQAKVPCRVSVAKDGEEALSYLHRTGQWSEAPRPELVLLDLNLPRKSGYDVLSEMKSTQRLLDIPVIILSTSESDQDVVRTYKMHANCFISKPLDPDEFFQVVAQTMEFWFTIVKRPTRAVELEEGKL